MKNNTKCDFVIECTGEKNDVNEFYKILLNSWRDKHMFCIDTDTVKLEKSEEKDNVYTIYVSGYCSLSIYACMLPAKGSHFYNNYIAASYIAKQCIPKDIDLSLYKGFQNATNIIELSRDLKLRIKIFGNNLKNDTMEWYEINNGQITNSFSS